MPKSNSLSKLQKSCLVRFMHARVTSFQLDAPGVNRKCYPAIRHKVDGDVINVRDCVLVSSGRSKSDVPYVAKIAALWENEQGESMRVHSPHNCSSCRKGLDFERSVPKKKKVVRAAHETERWLLQAT